MNLERLIFIYYGIRLDNMYSYYLPDDDNAYRYSYAPRRNTYRYNRSSVLDDGYDENIYYANSNLNDSSLKAKFTTISDYDNFSNRDSLYIRRNGDFFMTNRTYSSSDYDTSHNNKVLF